MGDDISANLWMAERRNRVTASSCGQIAKRRTTTKVASLVKTLLSLSFRGNTATQWGHIQEPLTKEAYLLEKRRVSPDIVVIDSGFVVHPHHHWLGASPDGLVNDPTSADPEGIVEYKNPYSIRLLALEDAASHGKDFYLVRKDGCPSSSCLLSPCPLKSYQLSCLSPRQRSAGHDLQCACARVHAKYV